MKRALLGIFALSVLILLTDIVIFLRTPLAVPQPYVDYVLRPGVGITSLARGLSQQGIVKRPLYLIGLAVVRRNIYQLQAGEYRIMPGTTPVQLLNQIVEGRMLHHLVTFVEGWTFDQMLAALRKQPSLLQTLSNLSQDAVMEKLGYPGEHPEGRFFPSTYFFVAGTKDTALLKQAYRTMSKRLNAEWKNRASNLSYKTPYDVLIVASLVEKETAIPDERAKVAGVILNRLKKNMRLQIDPTVIYGLGSAYTGKLRGSDLKFPSPYNTYLNRGLPPTPIAMPSLLSIRAALHPEQNDALYFVAKGDGSHQFSTTLVEHNKAVQAYRSKLQ